MKRAMGWQLYRWVWELRSPLHIGMPPAGHANRCRLYIPAHVLWGALTAELARVLKGNSFPEYFYFEVGEALRKKLRLTYLFLPLATMVPGGLGCHCMNRHKGYCGTRK